MRSLFGTFIFFYACWNDTRIRWQPMKNKKRKGRERNKKTNRKCSNCTTVTVLIFNFLYVICAYSFRVYIASVFRSIERRLYIFRCGWTSTIGEEYECNFAQFLFIFRLLFRWIFSLLFYMVFFASNRWFSLYLYLFILFVFNRWMFNYAVWVSF